MPEISIIVPVYNVERYLADCIRSVITQSFEDWEILLIDDGSQDGSASIAKEFAESDSRIRFFSQANQGPSVARNYGMDHASGRYVLFLDADDLYLSGEALFTLYENATEQKNDILCFNYARVEETGKQLSPDIDWRPASTDEQKKLELLVSNGAFTSSVCQKLIQKNVIENIRFQPGIRGEDIEFSAKMLLEGKNIGYLPHCFYGYRMRQGSATHRITPSFVFDLANITEKLAAYTPPENKKEAFYSFAAFQYSTLLLNWRLAKSPKENQMFCRMKQLSWLLQYDSHYAVKKVRFFYHILGLRGTSLLLLLYFKAQFFFKRFV